MLKIAVPEMGDGIKKATVSYWYVQKGQAVNKDDSLVELTTDKAAFNVPSPVSGVVTEIFANEGDTVEVGNDLAVINEVKS